MKNVTMMFLSTKHVQKGKAFALSLLMGLLLSPLGMMAQSTSTSNPSQAAKQKQEAKSLQPESEMKRKAVSKEYSRADIMKMSQEELKFNLGENLFIVKDLVNATSAQLSVRNPELFYVVASDFNDMPFERKVQILQNPSKYIVAASKSDIPKIQISAAEYNTLSNEKKEAIKNSGEFIIK